MNLCSLYSLVGLKLWFLDWSFSPLILFSLPLGFSRYTLFQQQVECIGLIDCGISYCVTFGTKLYDKCFNFLIDDINVIIGQKVVVMIQDNYVFKTYHTVPAWHIINFLWMVALIFNRKPLNFLYLSNGKGM